MTDEQTTKPSSRKPILYGTLTAVGFAIAGGSLIAVGSEAASLGATMFLFLPFATGFVTALTVRYWKAVGLSLLIATAICLTGLVFTGLEGIVCVLMALPILSVGTLVGALIGMSVRRSLADNQKTKSMALAPLLAGVSVMGVGAVEDQVVKDHRTETFTSSILIDAAPADVWTAMIEFDRVEGDKPLLMELGLPVPQSCFMDGTGVDAQRTCRFNSGFIRERVTRWEPPYRLDFTIEEVQLPGRHWLGFERALYRLEPVSTGETRVTRTTVVTSTLRPGFYWRYFERMGTEAEHDYILKALNAKFPAEG